MTDFPIKYGLTFKNHLDGSKMFLSKAISNSERRWFEYCDEHDECLNLDMKKFYWTDKSLGRSEG